MVSVEDVVAAAAQGNPIFPIGIQDGRKKPLVRWKTEATTDEQTIRKWWSLWPDAAVGRPEQDGEMTVDLDIKGDVNGLKSLNELLKDEPEVFNAFKNTNVVKTKSGGLHFKFTNPEGYDFGNNTGIWTGVDLRVGGKGLLVIPPSDGYKVINDKPRLPIPKRFYELYVERVGERRRTMAEIESSSDYTYTDGERTAYLTGVAAKYRSIGCDEYELYGILEHRSETRCNPRYDVEKLRAMAHSYAQYPIDRAEDYYQQLNAKAAAKLLTSNVPETTDIEEEKPVERINPNDPAIRSLADEEEIEFKYLWYPYMAMGTATGLQADGGTGKGTLCNYIAALATTGRMSELGQTDITEPVNVLMFSIEDSPAAKIRPEVRLAGGNVDKIAICKELQSGASFSFANRDVFDKAFKAVKPGLVIIDNAGDFGDTNNDGNNYKAVTQELTVLSLLAEKYNAAVLLILHENKRGGHMGSNAYRNKLRSLLSYKKTDEKNVRILKHEKYNMYEGKALLFRGEEAIVPDRKYPVWKMSYAGEATEEQAQRSTQEAVNDWLAERIAARPIPNSLLLQEAEESNWSNYHLSRARKAIDAGIVTINGVKCTANAFQITSQRLMREYRDNGGSQ